MTRLLLFAFLLCAAPLGAQTLDGYGGAITNKSGQTLATCSGGTHWTIQKWSNSRWFFCTPSGHALFSQSVYQVARSSMNGTFINTKYGNGTNAALNWPQDAVKRLKAWGFNGLGIYWDCEVAPIAACGKSGNAQQVPFTHIIRVLSGGGAFINRYGNSTAPTKRLSVASSECAVAPPAPDTICYHFRASAFIDAIPDFYDPVFSTYATNRVLTITNTEGTYPADFSSASDFLLWALGIVPDDADEWPFGQPGTGGGTEGLPGQDDGAVHPHAGLIIATSNPYITADTNPGRAGFVCASGCNPYADNVNHTKAAWITFLKSRYSNTIANLNTAWGTSGYYTTFDQDLGYPAANTGSHGVMDEDGGHAWFGTLGNFTALTGMNANLKQDIDDFAEQYVEQYWSPIKAARDANYPGAMLWPPAPQCGHAGLPRDFGITATMKYVDVYECVADAPRTTSLQHIYSLGCTAHTGCVPIVLSSYVTANADSIIQTPDASGSNPDVATQALRAGTIASTDRSEGAAFNNAFNLQGLNGDYMVAGFQMWRYADDPGQPNNYGLVTQKDNSYNATEPTSSTVACSVASVQVSPAVQCGGESVVAGEPYGDFITPLESLTGLWFGYVPLASTTPVAPAPTMLVRR